MIPESNQQICAFPRNSGAVISECGKYRYQLWRVWDEAKPLVLFIMLNPSTADATKNDRTISRCINFAKSWGYGGIMVGNIFAFRATKPWNLALANDPVGEGNNAHLIEMSLKSGLTVAAWGNGRWVERLATRKGLKPLEGVGVVLHYLELCDDGTPKHPLYLKKDLKPKPFSVPKIWIANYEKGTDVDCSMYEPFQFRK